MNDKKCKKCELTKSITEFFAASIYKGKQYYRGECKECNRFEQKSDQTSQEKYRNSERGKAIKSAYKKRREYRKQQTKYEINRYKTDPFYRTKRNIRRRLLFSLERRNWHKISKFKDYIGCDRETLIAHFEARFTEGMTWENQGLWHIDHIIPLSSATSEEELYKLCHYTNLQPLWAIDNIKKSNKT